MGKILPARCACGCDHLRRSEVVGDTWEVEFDHCKCDDLVGWEADMMNMEFHCVVPYAKYKFIPYFDYIKSKEWRKRSERAKRRAGYRCQLCNKSSTETQLQTHHRTYERLGCEKNEDLIVLCSDCHFMYEEQRKAKKAKLTDVL